MESDNISVQAQIETECLVVFQTYLFPYYRAIVGSPEEPKELFGVETGPREDSKMKVKVI